MIWLAVKTFRAKSVAVVALSFVTVYTQFDYDVGQQRFNSKKRGLKLFKKNRSSL
jgi:hypothetical protein